MRRRSIHITAEIRALVVLLDASDSAEKEAHHGSIARTMWLIKTTARDREMLDAINPYLCTSQKDLKQNMSDIRTAACEVIEHRLKSANSPSQYTV